MSANPTIPAGHIHSVSREEAIKLARHYGLHDDDIYPVAKIVRENQFERQILRTDGVTVRVLKLQDAKYGCLVEPEGQFTRGRLANLETGYPIPDDEPTFIMRAQDVYAAGAVEHYARSVEGAGTAVDSMTTPTASEAFMQFTDFARVHPERMKKPS